jgi:hypothetical protein
MVKKLMMVITAAMVLATGVATAQTPAPPGGRKGFVVGFGGGFGYSTWNESTYEYCGYYCGYRQVNSGNRSGVFTNFKIGFAPSDRLMILWHSSGTFFGSRYGSGFIMDGIGGLSVQYYFSSGPGAYALGGVGYHNIMRFDPGYGGENNLGVGVRGGFGFEFHRHWSVEAIVQHGFNESENNPTSVGVTVNWTWY